MKTGLPPSVQLRPATLTKLRTADGTFEMHEHIEVGRTFQVDVRSRQRMEFFHEPTRQRHCKEVVVAWDEDLLHGWYQAGVLPTEILDIETDA